MRATHSVYVLIPTGGAHAQPGSVAAGSSESSLRLLFTQSTESVMILVNVKRHTENKYVYGIEHVRPGGLE